MNQANKIKQKFKHWTYAVICLFSGEALAEDQSLGTMAKTITESFENVSKLITAGSYVAGLGFAISAIMKFKQHKDNPTNVPIGTPIGLTFIAAALLFLPSILGITGGTMFGSEGETAGPGGTIFQSGGGGG